MSELGKRIGQRIRELRTDRPERWTQEELAERARISVSFLSMIERGERVAHVETLEGLARALGVRLSDLFLEPPSEPAGVEDLLRPLADLVRARNLGMREVEKLVSVARALFDAQPSDPQRQPG